MKYRCKVCISPMRAEPSDAAEMISQLLFGESCVVIEKQEKFWKIRMDFDGYEGWIDPKQIESIDDHESYQILQQKWKEIVSPKGNLMVSLGTEIPSQNVQEINVPPRNYIAEKAQEFLGVPYLWGGRSAFGIDCSGLSQVIYKAAKIPLPRDSYQQAEVGQTMDFLSEIQPGDLAFFTGDSGKITHVGIMLSPEEIIHAHGEVRLDMLDAVGIYNREQKKHTHKLAFVKSIIH